MQDAQRQRQSFGELQKHLLPRDTRPLEGWELAVHYAIGSWPGGDYYDFLPLPDGRLLFLVADASDVGGPAIVMDVLVHATLHSCPLSSGTERLPFCPMRGTIIQPPHLILGHLNRVLVENTLAEQFMTAFCGVISPADGELRYAGAGHPSPRWWRSETGAVESLPDAPGMPLGVTAHACYHHRRVALSEGDVLVCYTDGLTAALNEGGQQFGVKRLDRAIADAAADGAEAIRRTIQVRLEKFLEGAASPDDITLIVLERRR